jgi:hypothetical protein
MSWYTRLFDPVVFDPKLLASVQKAFDAAWAMYTVDYGTNGPVRDEAREIIAKAIMEKARSGETDIDSLKSHALSELLRFRNLPAGQFASAGKN